MVRIVGCDRGSRFQVVLCIRSWKHLNLDKLKKVGIVCLRFPWVWVKYLSNATFLLAKMCCGFPSALHLLHLQSLKLNLVVHSIIQLLLWVLRSPNSQALQHWYQVPACPLYNTEMNIINFPLIFYPLPSSLPVCLLDQLEYFSSHVQHDSVRKPLLFVLVEEQLRHCHGHHLQPHRVGLTEPNIGSPGRFFCRWPNVPLKAAVNVLTQLLLYVL